MIAKTSSLLLAGVAVCVVGSEARPASACDVDGIHAAASAQARQAFSVAGTGSGMSSSVVTALTTTLTSRNPAVENGYRLSSGVEARKVASQAGGEPSLQTEDRFGGVRSPFDGRGARMSILVGAWSMQSDYVHLFEPMSSSAWSLQSGYVRLIDTMSSSEILLQPASATPKSD